MTHGITPTLTASRPHQGKSTGQVVDTLAFLVGRIGCPNPRNPSSWCRPNVDGSLLPTGQGVYCRVRLPPQGGFEYLLHRRYELNCL